MNDSSKVLYLDGNLAIQVLRDGPALKIRKPDTSDVLFPLRQISRVVSTGPLHFSTDALLGCADYGIPVVFTRKSGEVRGCLFPRSNTTVRSDYHEYLEEYFEMVPNAVELHRIWFQALSRQYQVAYARACSGLRQDASEYELNRFNLRLSNKYAKSKQIKRVNSYIISCLKAHLHHLLYTNDSGIQNNSIISVSGIDLVRDYASILVWVLEDSKQKFLRQAYHRARRQGELYPTISTRDAAEIYENNASSIEAEYFKLRRRHIVHLMESLSGNGYGG